ncbi:MAG: HIT family protein [Deltaproteobacteria bacterium]|nr:HIT family protein [Deltaproteobacteria bacterium]
MRNCIFCDIVAGRTPAVKIMETHRTLAFLDIAPVHYGHTLIIPKAHHQNLLDLPDELWLEMGQASRRVAGALMKALYARGFNIGMNNFDAAGQVVYHAHLHVIPRYLSDGLHFFPQGDYQPGDMEKVGQQLRQALE